MKILQVIDQLGLGGAERVCVNMANLLHRYKYDVKIVVFDNSGPLFELIDEGIEVVILGRKKRKFKAYKTLIKEVKEADIVHVHMRQNYKYVKKTLLAYGVKKKLILHDHYGEIAVNKRIPTFYRSFYKPDLYIGCSKLLTDWALHRVGLDSKIVFLVHNFVLKYKVDLPENIEKKGLVFVGNMKPVKNHFFAVELAKELNLDLTIYCSKTDNSYFKTLQKKIESIGMSNRVFFQHGSINVQTELYKYNYALLTSTSEGDPLALIEYLSQGIPFLSYNIGESVKIIQKHFPSFVQDTFDKKEWLDNFKKMQKITNEEVFSVYNQHYSAQGFLDKYIAIYKKLM
ncbi:glycosyltransferase [Flavobacteriaceae bacterium]|nr:glycosyltransferase [Flavobacteriaceae bacterium]MDA9254179.1 glycosyltransferase [Flavobacteriaceae bacterium]MDB4227999.1 glycosyltransferase [Flavobacteriaceae bacterium]